MYGVSGKTLNALGSDLRNSDSVGLLQPLLSALMACQCTPALLRWAKLRGQSESGSRWSMLDMRPAALEGHLGQQEPALGLGHITGSGGT